MWQKDKLGELRGEFRDRLIPVADLLPTDDDSLLVAARRAVREAYPDKPYVVLAAAKLLAALRAEEVEAL